MVRRRQTTEEKLDWALATLKQQSTVDALLKAHTSRCTDGDSCPVAAALRRRLQALKSGS